MSQSKDIIKDDLQQAAIQLATGATIAAGVRDEIITTGAYVVKAVVTPATEAISQGPAATLAYVNSLQPTTQLNNAVETLVDAAAGDEVAQAKLNDFSAKAKHIATAIPVSLGENTAKAELAGKSGNPYEFGVALGAAGMTVLVGPEGKAVEAAIVTELAVTGAKEAAIEGVLVDSATGAATKDLAAATLAQPSLPSAAATNHNVVSNALANSNLPESAKSILSPIARILDEGKKTVLPPVPITLTEHFDQARINAYKQDNAFKQALDRIDSHIDANTGMTIAQKQHYNDWNKAQVPARMEFYKELFEKRPELAQRLEQYGIYMR